MSELHDLLVRATDVIDPPSSSPLLSDDPVAAAVVAIQRAGLAQVLGTDGGWRTVPIDGRYPILSLSPGGTRLAVYYYFDDRTPEPDYGVTVHDLVTGDSFELAPPAGFVPWDDTGWSFLDEETLLLNSGPQGYVVAADTGETEKTSLPPGLSSALDSESNWLVSADFDQPNVLTDYAGNDSNWRLGPMALADDGTVLLRVAAIGRQVDGFRVVSWEPTTGELSVVSRTDLPVEASVVFAGGFLRQVDPG